MRKTCVLLLLILVSACASAGSKSSAESRTSRDLITRVQIEESNAANAYDLIQRARPEVLRPRGQTSIRSGPELPVVYVDGVRRGSPETLKQIRLTELDEIRFVSGTDATTRYGTGHGGGVIEIKTRHGQIG